MGGIFSYAGQLRAELAERNRLYARSYPHVESYSASPVVVYAPEEDRHGNFFLPAYAAICHHPQWIRRFDKIHAQGRLLPKPQLDPKRKWRELDSCMSSDALLMNIFCTPEANTSVQLRSMFNVEGSANPEFGWKAKVPLRNGRVDRTEVDMCWGDLLVEAKLTESDFQTREANIAEAYRDLDKVFDREALPKIQLRTRRRRSATELPEEFTQEWESPTEGAEDVMHEFHAELEARADAEQPWQSGYAGYQLIRNVLAAYASNKSFCVILDQRRPDLREAWFRVMSAIRTFEMRMRCKVLTWQELVPFLPSGLREFLEIKYGVFAPGVPAVPIEASRDRSLG